MENTNREQAIEDIQRMIVNQPVKAYMQIGVDIMGAINDNGGIMFMCLKNIIKCAVVIMKNFNLLFRCILSAFKHMIMLAFYPLVKLYYIMGARKEILRQHPEYRQPRR